MRTWAFILAAIFLIGALHGGAASHGQEPGAEITVDEIVARHEATWAKLRRLRILFEEHSSLSHGNYQWTFKEGAVELLDENLVRVLEVHTGESKSTTELNCDGARYEMATKRQEFRRIDERIEGGVRKRIAEYVTKPTEPKEYFQDGVPNLTTKTDRFAHRKTNFSWLTPLERRFGGGVGYSHFTEQITLKKWVARHRPALKRVRNEKEETCYELAGDYRSPVRSVPPRKQIDRLVVTINADRGYMIEQMRFDRPEQEEEISVPVTQVVWRVEEWLTLPSGVSFPASLKTEWIYAEPAIKCWAVWRVLKVDDAPKFRTAEGREPQVDPSSPAGSRAQLKEMEADEDSVEINHAFEAAMLFPDYVVEAPEDNKEPFGFVIVDREGNRLREINTLAEIETVRLVQDLLRFSIAELVSEIAMSLPESALAASILGEENDAERANFAPQDSASEVQTKRGLR